ncbi:MAG: tetratricopeptide repeat protein [Magnetococcales bacterium]|nr:tetratricopeptide repeat protein [Magnetococcales bacterium]MBF0321729.1 tetratricopeptide repeat protein [Magnetococcales bacterium]
MSNDDQQRRLTAALSRAPQDLQLRYDLAAHLWENGSFHGAREVLSTLLSVAPDQPEANFMLGQLLLLLGRFAEGWARYAWRYRMEYARKLLPGMAQPYWQGGDLAGKTLLVFGEQGFGDTLQFARFIPLLRTRGEGKIVVGCSPPLQRLLLSLPGEAPVVSNPVAAGPFDWQVPVSDLPGLVGADLALLAALPVPYVWADPAEVERWRSWRRQAVTTRWAVGVVWAGRPTHAHDRRRSIPWPVFSRLCRLSDATLVSLQLPKPSPEILQSGVLEVSDVLVDFAATAAAMMALDLIVTVDTATAHLAGALGRPVWTLLPRVPDWRWLLERTDSPWYPSMRLFRQQTPDDWSEVMDRVVAAWEVWTATPMTVAVQSAHSARDPAAWDPLRQGSPWRWPTGIFFPPQPPLQEEMACRCCKAHARWAAAVDFSRCQADAVGLHLPHAGTPVDYYHCPRCGCRMTRFFDLWEPARLHQSAVDPLRTLAAPGRADPRQRLWTILQTWLAPGPDAHRILVIDSVIEFWEGSEKGGGWQLLCREPFQELLPFVSHLAPFGVIVLVDTLHRHPWPDVFLKELTAILAPGGTLLLALDAAPEEANALVFPAYTPRNGLAVLHTCRSLETLFRRHGLSWRQPEPGVHVGKRSIV